MLIIKGPRLFRNFQRDQPQPAPIAVDQEEMIRDLEDLREARERIEQLRPENEDVPQLPDGADSSELIFDEEAP
jgi:hypothetical protein